MNSKKIKRLDEARDFVKRVRGRGGNIRDDNVFMTGHSLGGMDFLFVLSLNLIFSGFIAEGVSNDYRGRTRTVTFAAAGPVLKRGSDVARAFSQGVRQMPATRFSAKGDFVPTGAKNLNHAAQSIARGQAYGGGISGRLREHSLNNDLPWMSTGRSKEEADDIKRRWGQRKMRNTAKKVGNFLSRF